MSVKVNQAREQSSGRILHIDHVYKSRNLKFECVSCLQPMIPVKTVSRGKAWHFRHLAENPSCFKPRETALHAYAMQVLMENRSVRISKDIFVEYSEPRKEACVFDYRSDVCVTSEEREVHFEIFVHNDLTREKISCYQANKVRCVRIDLSARPLLSASHDAIRNLVLTEYANKRIIYWNEAEVEVEVTPVVGRLPRNNALEHLFFFGALFMIGRWIYNNWLRRRRKRRGYQ